MKIILLSAMAILGITTMTPANTPENLVIRVGQQKSAARGSIKVKFVNVEEDSRCAPNAACVWVGNARVKITVTSRGGTPKTMVINTDMGPKGDQHDGWAIYLTSLTPLHGSNVTTAADRYIATFSIVRLSR